MRADQTQLMRVSAAFFANGYYRDYARAQSCSIAWIYVGVRSVRVKHVIFLAVSVLLCAEKSEAGTGGIFSSTTGPRRKIQQIQPVPSIDTSSLHKSVVKPTIAIPPTPGTIFFDEKNSGKSEQSLHGDAQMRELQETLSGAASTDGSATAGKSDTAAPPLNSDGNAQGLRSGANLQLRGLSGSASKTEDHNAGSVESFFQISGTPSRAGASPVFPDASMSRTGRSNEGASPPQPSAKSAAAAPFRFLWHVMDNAGVPMFFGKSDENIDPSLRQGYASAISAPTSLRRPVDSNSGVSESGAANTPSVTPHKIPESELEGTDSWVKDNEQMP